LATSLDTYAIETKSDRTLTQIIVQVIPQYVQLAAGNIENTEKLFDFLVSGIYYMKNEESTLPDLEL